MSVDLRQRQGTPASDSTSRKKLEQCGKDNEGGTESCDDKYMKKPGRGSRRYWRWKSFFHMNPIIFRVLVATSLVSFFVQCSPSFFNSKLDTIIYLNTTKGAHILKNTDLFYSMDFYRLQDGVDVQSNEAHCAVASVVAVLNSLRSLVAVSTEEFWPYPYLTQENIFNECTNQNSVYYNEDERWDGILIMPYGMSLRQTSAMLQCHLPEDWTITTHYVDSSLTSLEEMRNTMTRALVNPNARLIINFHREALGQSGRGHWSPVVAYSPVMDAFLIMDVAKYKSPPFWVPGSRLFDSLATIDVCGSWNPQAQRELPEDLRWPRSKELKQKAREAVGCRISYRGFIVIEPKLEPTS